MWKIMVADHKNQAPHRNEVSQNALLENCICFIFRQMTFLRQKLAENRRFRRLSLTTTWLRRTSA